MGDTQQILMAGSAASSGWADIQAGRTAAMLAGDNARIAEWQAEGAERRGKAGAEKHRRDVKRLIGTQRARQAASGVVVDQDTAAAVVDETDRLGEIDALEIENNARLEAWGYRVQAQDYRTRGRMARAESIGRAGSTLMTMGAQVYRQEQRRRERSSGQRDSYED